MVGPTGSYQAGPRPPTAGGGGSNAIVQYTAPALAEEEEELEIKLRRIIENVPVRVNNTSGSSAGSGSSDFHQMRRREQDRLIRMGVDYQKRKEMTEFIQGREERMKALLSVIPLSLSSFHHFCISLKKEPSPGRSAMAKPHDPGRIFVHQALGGGSVADILLWRRWFRSTMLLVLSTIVWDMFERDGYSLLTFLINALLVLVVILFFWAKSASLLNRPLPPIPNLEISEKSITKATNFLLPWINHALFIARDIAVNHNMRLFLQVSIGLCILSFVGSLFSLLTFGYIGIILSLSVPFFYDRYQDHADAMLCVINRFVQAKYLKFEDSILKMIPPPPRKEKKIR
ncbi:hypothetical protein SAY87_027398 [Trapa incisa]|uniref:Reticulon-like protein n=1 Tax=Trapa incisa TaxID=236973 RepID=A0AAN7JLS0_9MYRT|nr:hypothetical protein SAY87_027398 [Trapa incisa]